MHKRVLKKPDGRELVLYARQPIAADIEVPELSWRAQQTLRELGYENVEFRKGHAENIPDEDGSIDLIISNCVINLAPDKAKVFREMYRVIRPGGRSTISDIVADQPVPNYLIHDTEKWGDCLSGALPVWEYLRGLVQAGLLGVHQMKQKPVVKNGAIVIGDVMLLSLSFDHRIIDGHIGAAFAYEVIGFLQEPDSLLLEV